MDLRQSILRLERYEFPCSYEQALYLNLEEEKIEIWNGSGWPRAAEAGRWRLVCDVPPRATARSVVKNLLEVLPLLEADIEAYRQGDEPDSDYGEFEFEIYAEPQQLLKPILGDLRQDYQTGLTPMQALEKIPLQSEAGVLDPDETRAYLEKLWAEWEAAMVGRRVC